MSINEQAVYILPNNDLFIFYKQHIDYVKEHAIDADKRKFTNHKEVTSHYIDLDLFESELPFDTVNSCYSDMEIIYGQHFLQRHGKLPWIIINNYNSLVKAFTDKDLSSILKYSADIGHYISDAHVPLHTHSNYDGQNSNQQGIHSLWETQVPHLFIDTLILNNVQVEYISDLDEFVWNCIFKSHQISNDVFRVDSILREEYQNEVMDLVNFQGKTKFKRKYCEDFSESLSLKIHERYEKACVSVASMWLSAWIDAGQPDLKEFYD